MRSHYIILTLVLVGCAEHRSVQVTPLPSRSPEPPLSSGPIPVLMPQSYSVVEQTLMLSVSHPVTPRGDYKVRLVSIAADGTTRIRVVETGRELTLRPGEFFDGAEFGSQGLQLISASRMKGTASLISRDCISE